MNGCSEENEDCPAVFSDLLLNGRSGDHRRWLNRAQSRWRVRRILLELIYEAKEGRDKAVSRSS